MKKNSAGNSRLRGQNSGRFLPTKKPLVTGPVCRRQVLKSTLRKFFPALKMIGSGEVNLRSMEMPVQAQQRRISSNQSLRKLTLFHIFTNHDVCRGCSLCEYLLGHRTSRTQRTVTRTNRHYSDDGADGPVVNIRESATRNMRGFWSMLIIRQKKIRAKRYFSPATEGMPHNNLGDLLDEQKRRFADEALTGSIAIQTDDAARVSARYELNTSRHPYQIFLQRHASKNLHGKNNLRCRHYSDPPFKERYVHLQSGEDLPVTSKPGSFFQHLFCVS